MTADEQTRRRGSPSTHNLKPLSFYGSLLQSRVKAAWSSGTAEAKANLAPELHALVCAVSDACRALYKHTSSDEELLRQGVISGKVWVEALCDAMDGALFFGLRPPTVPAAIARRQDARLRGLGDDRVSGLGNNCGAPRDTWCEFETPHFRSALVNAVSAVPLFGALRQCLEDSDSSAFVCTAHGSCRAWHRYALRRGALLEALRELFASPKIYDVWYGRSVVA